MSWSLFWVNFSHHKNKNQAVSFKPYNDRSENTHIDAYLFLQVMGTCKIQDISAQVGLFKTVSNWEKFRCLIRMSAKIYQVATSLGKYRLKKLK